MQTFLPYPSFYESARCLDNKRLGKQRVEAWQIYCALTVPGYGWQNHPAVRQWKNYNNFLIFYGIMICLEWLSRGYKDSCLRKFLYAKEIYNSEKSFKNKIGMVGRSDGRGGLRSYPQNTGEQKKGRKNHKICFKNKNCNDSSEYHQKYLQNIGLWQSLFSEFSESAIFLEKTICLGSFVSSSRSISKNDFSLFGNQKRRSKVGNKIYANSKNFLYEKWDIPIHPEKKKIYLSQTTGIEKKLIPPWLGNKQFHSAHRAILLAKNYDWYKQFGWAEKPAEKVNGKWPYVWPV